MSWAKHKHSTAKWGGGEFNALPRQFTRSQMLRSLSPHACKLFLDLQAQYNGFNNGDLCITWSVMKLRGWRSKATLHKTTGELLGIGLIERSRPGHRRQCALYALSLYDIDDCGGKHDLKPTSAPSRTWLKHEPVKPLSVLQAEFKVKQQTALKSVA